MKHSVIFWIAIGISLLTGFYGLLSGQLVLFVPYALINPVILFAVSALFKDRHYKYTIELLSSLILFINVPGSVYFHSLGIQYDIPLHLFASFFAFEILAVALFTKIKSRKALLITAFVLVVIGGILFEGVQKTSDILFGTKLFFDEVQYITTDIIVDLSMNTTGALLGLILALFRVSFVPPPRPSDD